MGKVIYGVTLPFWMLVTACSSDAVDIGDDKTGDNLADYAGNWDGYVEAWDTGPDSDRFRITLDASGTGSIEFGDAPPLPPPADPDVGYPVGMFHNMRTVSPPLIAAGFRYPIYRTVIENRRIRFSARTNDLIREWCQMQTPIMVDSGYMCVPGAGGGRSHVSCADPNSLTECCYTDLRMTMTYQVDCGKLALCTGLCGCDANGCDVPQSHQENYDIHLDIALAADGTDMNGTMLVDARLNIRLTRQ